MNKKGSHMTRRAITSKVNVEWLSQWLRKCASGHVYFSYDLVYRNSSNNVLNILKNGHFKVIDIISMKLVAMQEMPKYFAVSYVWGTAMRNYIKAVSPSYACNITFQPRTELHLDLTGVPRIVFDAIELLKGLGKQYLWIDAICIKQRDQAEKSLIIPRIGDIYRCAYATIFGVLGSSNDGLAGVTISRNASLKPLTFVTKGNVVSLVPSRPSLPKLLSKTVWDTRAWTCQEKWFSRRSIFFFLDEVVCSCL